MNTYSDPLLIIYLARTPDWKYGTYVSYIRGGIHKIGQKNKVAQINVPMLEICWPMSYKYTTSFFRKKLVEPFRSGDHFVWMPHSAFT